MKHIKLTRGEYALVDDEDFEFLSQWSWCCTANGYAVRGERHKGPTKVVLMHRVLSDVAKGQDVDHINKNKLDNQRSNLRTCTRSENLYHRGLAPTNTSGYKGVVWWPRDNKWMAQIVATKKRYFLGYFVAKEDAARAYNEAALIHHGEFAYQNIIGVPNE